MPERLLTRDFALVTAGHFLQAVGYASMVLLPVYLEHLGASRALIGTIMASAAVSGLAARPAVAWMLDRVGYRATVLAGTATLSAGLALFGLADSIGPALLLARLVVGVGTGALFTAYFALASRIVPISRRTQGLALFGISGLVPLLVNPLAEGLGVAPPQLRWFFPAVAGVVLLSTAPVLALRERGPAPTATRPGLRGTLRALRQPGLRPVWLATVALAGLAASFMAYATVAAAARGAAHPAALWFAYAGGAALVRVLLGGAAERVGPGAVLPYAFAAFAGAGLVAAFAASDAGFLAAGLLAGLGHGIGFPILTSLAVSRTPDEMRGAGVATLTGFWELSTLTLTPGFGLLADLASDEVMFIGLAALAGAVALSWRPLERRAGSG